MPDGLKRQTIYQYARAAGAAVVIETGTYHGDTTAYLARKGLRVVSIEIDPDLAARAQARFESNPLVSIEHGDSAQVLPAVLSGIDEPVCFWLDGHWSGGPTGGSPLSHPLLAELRSIADHHRVMDHVILIDDARLFGSEGYPSFEAIRQALTLQADRCAYLLLDIVRSHAIEPPLHRREGGGL